MTLKSHKARYLSVNLEIKVNLTKFTEKKLALTSEVLKIWKGCGRSKCSGPKFRS